jgi:hypothetical protein
MDSVNPELLGMSKVISEDAARRALSNIDKDKGIEWLDTQMSFCTMPLISAARQHGWILDTDVTVKCLYGKQEGAVKGYNPNKPGRPSHTYHSYFMANTRLAMRVEVKPGNQSSSKYTAAGLWDFIDDIPEDNRPAFIRGDSIFGVDPVLSEAERRGIDYVTKLRITKNVKRLIDKFFNTNDWVDAGAGFRGVETSLKLMGWNKERRVIVLRRRVTGDILQSDHGQKELAFMETIDKTPEYEYSVLVTSLKDEIRSIAQHYRDRSDIENCFDELKNQWGWCGYTTKDMKRCSFMSRMVALFYNWWSLFVRLANPDKHYEAISSRPLLLHGIAKLTKHAGQINLTITSNHAKYVKVKAMLEGLTCFLKGIKETAEQLSFTERLRYIFVYAYRKMFSPNGIMIPAILPNSG